MIANQPTMGFEPLSGETCTSARAGSGCDIIDINSLCVIGIFFVTQIHLCCNNRITSLFYYIKSFAKICRVVDTMLKHTTIFAANSVPAIIIRGICVTFNLYNVSVIS